MSPPLEVLLRSLRLAGLDIDAEAALDSLWLGREIVVKQRSPASSTETSTPRSTSATDVVSSGAATGTEKRGSGSTKRRDSLSLRASDVTETGGARTESTAARARSLTLERAAALPASRDLIKALRPLRRRVVSPGAGVLDVDATVRRAAEEDLWFPTFASARERWLDVLLVADHGISMILWKDTIDELERVLRNSGAFRSVRSLWLESDAQTVSVTARGRGASPPTPERLSRMTRGTGRSVILILSDCVGARWHDGTIPRLIGTWSRALPVGLMQVTPEWFWTRTALGDTVNSRFRSAVPAAVNHRFRWDASALGGMGDSMEGGQMLLRVPAVALTSDAVTRLAELIAGVGREWAPGVVFDLSWEGEETIAEATPVVAEERVARFRALASKPAQRLAAGFAASPVRTLGVLRLLRRDLLPESTPFAEAEVLLGGVIRVKRAEANWELGASLPLEFVPGVQSLLLDGAIASDVLRVLTHAAAVAESGVGATFTSWLENPSSGASQLDPSESEFAAAAAQVLERLGGAYSRIIKTGIAAADGAASASTSAGRVGTRPSLVGTPHQLPCPTVLHGRQADLFQASRWINEDTRQPLVIVGEAGIGKSALAGQLVHQWTVNWPDRRPFVWCFQKNRSVSEAFAALREHFDPPNTKEIPAHLRNIIGGVSRGVGDLTVFDGADAISDGELENVLRVVASSAEAVGRRFLLTSRLPLTERLRAEQIPLGPLDTEAVHGLVMDLMSPRGRSESYNRDVDLMIGVAGALGGGNPLVIKQLVAQTGALPAEALAEELVADGPAPHPIEPEHLPDLDRRVHEAVRARDLCAEGESAFEAGNVSQAFRAFDEVVHLRSNLPSRRRRARALFDRGRAAFVMSNFELAAADLADAAGLYRSLSANRELVKTFISLAAVRVRTDRTDEALKYLYEALDIARSTEDTAAVVEVSLQAASLQIQRRAFETAIGLLRAAMEAALSIGDVRSAALASLSIAGSWQLMSNVPAAIEANYDAVRHLLDVDEPALLAQAYDNLASLYESIGDYLNARRALENVRELRPPNADAIEERIRQLDTRMEGDAQRQTATSDDVLEGHDDRTLSVEFIVHGRVSGVGYRMFAQKSATELGIDNAHAENMPDGRIRVGARGRRPQLKQLRELLRRGPLGASVVDVDTRIVPESA